MKYLPYLTVLAIFLGTGIVFSPRLLNLYYQTQGGKLLDGVIRQNDATTLTCTYPAHMSGETFIQIDRATALLQKAVRADPKESQSHLLLGRAYCLRGEPDEAIPSYLAYVHLRPENPLGQMELGFAYAAACQKRSREGGEVATPLERLLCTDDTLRAEAAVHWRKSGLTTERLIVFGAQAQRAGQAEEALLWYARAVAAAPGRSQAWYKIVQHYQSRQEWPLALQSARLSIAANRHPQGLSNLYFLQGVILQYYLEPPDAAAAWDSYRRALAVDDYFLNSRQKAATYHNQGVLLAWQHDWESAVAEYRQALALQSDDYATLIDLANALWKLGKRAEARNTAFQAVNLQTDDFQAYLALARFSLEEQNIADARYLFQKVLELNPRSEEARRALESLEDPK